MVRAWDQGVCSPVVLGSSPVVVNIDGHWRLTWSLTSGPVMISRGARKLARTPHINNNNNNNNNNNTSQGIFLSLYYIEVICGGYIPI
jgi:hypothetical protein